MILVKGKATEAKVFTNDPQETAITQIKELCDQSFLTDAKIRIMPDYHAGKGCVIGTTIELQDKVVPNLVGVDVGCGVYTVKLANKQVDFARLDDVIRKHIPSGRNIHTGKAIATVQTEFPAADRFRASHLLTTDKNRASLGTLGGGNHFIEVSKDEEGFHYITIHSGSRYVGARIADYYQKLAIEHKTDTSLPDDLAYLEGNAFNDYIFDMKLAQNYALANRTEMARMIIDQMNFDVLEQFDTVHNYIDTEQMILRKGAVSAQKGERLIIPLNMRDGSIIAVGKGNPDWNYSAPHGAGRVLSRTQAMSTLNMKDFADTMKDVWSTSVVPATLDEAPMAYKQADAIINQVTETLVIEKRLKPVYNFKASDQSGWRKKRRKKRK